MDFLNFKTGDRGLDLIKLSESLRLTAYLDTGGVPTLGYGHTRGVTMGMTCTEAQADKWLVEDVVSAENDVKRLVKVELVQGQFDALVSFVFNLGGPQFADSTLLRKLNQGDYIGAAGEFGRWIYDNGKKLNGLVIRRERERQLFLFAPGFVAP